MSKENTASSTPLWMELFNFALYKPTQGRNARQVTGFTLAAAVCVGAWRFFQVSTLPEGTKFPIAMAIAIVGCWICYRVVNWSPFADFLIGVEAEMNKVSWPSWLELKRSSGVVIVLIFGLTAVLFICDTIWLFLLSAIGVVKTNVFDWFWSLLGF